MASLQGVNGTQTEKEIDMAKDNPTPSASNPAAAAAPLFAFARTVIDELDQQGERWLQYGVAQSSESLAIARTMREQALGISRNLVATVEQMAAGALDTAAAWSKPFGRGIG